MGWCENARSDVIKQIMSQKALKLADKLYEEPRDLNSVIASL